MRRVALLVLPLLTMAASCGEAAIGAAPGLAAEPAVRAPAPALSLPEGPGLKTAIFAGGCFWGVEGVFSHLRGVTSVVSGYHGGSQANASYDRVSTGTTGHAEAVRVRYDPARIGYGQLLQVYFSVVADPTRLNAQGPDTGTQYRSALVPVGETQRRIAQAYLAQLRASGLWRRPIVTAVERAQGFYPAEAQHQDFMAHNPSYPYIVRWDAPKVAALQRLYPALYQPAFTPR